MPRFACLYVTPRGLCVWTPQNARVMAEWERQRASLAAPLPCPAPLPPRATHRGTEARQ